MAGQTAGPIETKLSTQGVFLARSMSRSFMYACGTDRSTKHPESDTWRTMLKLRPDDGRGDTWRTITKLHSSRNEARRCRRRAASANGASRTPSGGRVIRASKIYLPDGTNNFTVSPCRICLRTANSSRIWDVGTTRTQTRVGDRSFVAVAGPRLWNNLLVGLRQQDTCLNEFRRLLKMFLFC